MSSYTNKIKEDYWNIGKRLKTDYTGKSYYTSHSIIGRGVTAELRGSPIIDEQDINELVNILSGRNKNNITEYVLGQPEEGTKEKSHQHFAIVLNNPKNIKWPEVIEFASGKMVMLYATPLSTYSEAHGDIDKFIEYLKKKGEKPLKHYKNEKNVEMEGTKQDKPDAWKIAVKNAYDIPEWKDAAKYLENVDPVNFYREEGKIKSRWMKKHSRDIDMDATYKKDLLPWKDLPVLNDIREWIGKAAKNLYRSGNLFIIGPTKTGKTEFIIQEAFRKYLSFMLRGNFMWDRFDEDKDYKFYIFDDVAYNKQSIEQIKALTSSINVPTMINVKFSHVLPKSKPCIHLMNKQEFAKFKTLANWNGGEQWWRRNSTIFFIKERVFKTPADLLKEQLENPEEETMSENSVNSFEENEEVEQQEENEEQEEAEKVDEQQQEKKPKEYTAKKKHSFRSRFKHALRILGKDEDEVQNMMKDFDESRLENLQQHEAIEYGLDNEDELSDHPSMQEEYMFEKEREDLMRERENTQSQQLGFDKEVPYDDDTEEDNGLPPSTQGFTLGKDQDIIYD